MHEFDECFMPCKGTVWRDITDTKGTVLDGV